MNKKNKLGNTKREGHTDRLAVIKKASGIKGEVGTK